MVVACEDSHGSHSVQAMCNAKLKEGLAIRWRGQTHDPVWTAICHAVRQAIAAVTPWNALLRGKLEDYADVLAKCVHQAGYDRLVAIFRQLATRAEVLKLVAIRHQVGVCCEDGKVKVVMRVGVDNLKANALHSKLVVAQKTR